MSKSGWLVPASLLITSMAAATAHAAVFKAEPLQIPSEFSDVQKGNGGLNFQVNSVLVQNNLPDQVVGLVYGAASRNCRTRDVRFKFTTTAAFCARGLNGVLTTDSVRGVEVIAAVQDPLTAESSDLSITEATSAATGYFVENVVRDIANTSNGIEVVGYSHFDVTAGEWPTGQAVIRPSLAIRNTATRTTRAQLNNTALPTLTSWGNEDNMANAINAGGVIVGWSRHFEAVDRSSLTCSDADDSGLLDVLSNCTITDHQRAVVYPSNNRQAFDLGAYQTIAFDDVDKFSFALDVSDDGTAPVVVGRVGDFSRAEGDSTISWARGFWFRITDATDPQNGHGTTFAGIAADGDSDSGIVAPLVDNEDYDTSLSAINTGGIAVGSSQVSATLTEAISFDTSSPNEAAVGLGYLETDLSSSASAVSDSGIIGGNAVVRRTSVSTGSERHGFLYFPAGSDVVNTDSVEIMLDASNLIDCSQGIVITGINKIVGDSSNPVIYASAVATAAADDSLQGKVFSVRLTRANDNDPTAPSAPQVCVPEKPLNDSGGGAAGGLMIFAGWLAVCLRRRKFLK
ncbi:hypothetical protein [Pelagibaculum spongiae]|nr:hypothetical protein [Pelagibaculum spongiae]